MSLAPGFVSSTHRYRACHADDAHLQVEQWIEQVFPQKEALPPGESPEEKALARKEAMLLMAVVLTTLFMISGLMVS